VPASRNLFPDEAQAAIAAAAAKDVGLKKKKGKDGGLVLIGGAGVTARYEENRDNLTKATKQETTDDTADDDAVLFVDKKKVPKGCQHLVR
jgi:hypothetical protein